ncbi:protein-tyrosine phosphatase-like protein [Naematelia encephala]|uniref:protein-tyrosine-phosphatase n=1 Tax=Naematelia encephala TaxID=71784 RepID=A0A1Y2AX80_9TREE|nr:protein-tyrosine phosphatase-like protein [Naematelia encephala]
MPPRSLPHPVAVFNDRFIFTTLSSRDVQSHERVPFCHPTTGKPVTIFSLDEEIKYTPFALDHGPMNLAMTFLACVAIHDKINAKETKHKSLCLYTATDSKAKSNMALMAALYFLVVMREEPWEAFMPIAHFEVLSFRDAGNGPMHHGLSIQDCLHGIHKAIENDLLDFSQFNPRHYQYYEAVQNGDLNILGPFIPFASPQEPAWIKSVKSGRPPLSHSKGRVTSHALRCVLDVFQEQNVGMVVRLNEELYDRRHFLELGMDHVEMYFHDGSNPSDSIVRQFIDLVEEVIENRGQKVAVHCKAGLGRTGVLIGAYLIYKYAFSAQEVIGYMRIVRPGMVVGPQQQYLLKNQMKWVGWAARDQALREIASPARSVNPLATPPAEEDCVLPNQLPLLYSSMPSSQSGYSAATRPAQKGGDAAGQPRKSPVHGETYINRSTHEPVVDVQPPSPTPSLIELMEYREMIDSSSSPLVAARGTKRAAGRTTVSSTFTTSSAHLDARVSSVVSLQRSPSSSSMLSSVSDRDIRPAKRRGIPVDRQTGLSSPPPSRESSPAEPEVNSLTVLLPISSVPDLAETERQKAAILASSVNPRRSFLPIRRASPTTAKNVKPLETVRPTPDVRAGRRTTPHNNTSARSLLTPPRLAMQVLGTIQRMRATPPSRS